MGGLIRSGIIIMADLFFPLPGTLRTEESYHILSSRMPLAQQARVQPNRMLKRAVASIAFKETV